ncbi:MAG: DUF4358 domain-containing protein [Huintestinicola sp.]|uniref:DUF4358 domain-containing protein n=1 Tax=Huintestinicola sp. TaxID=2981661 RepID=UPI003F0E812D
MNKKIAMLAALLAVGMTFAACGGSKNEETTETAADTTVSETSDTASAETEEDILPEESESLEVSADDTDEELADDESDGDESAEPVVPEETVSDNPLYPAVEKALSESEWPSLMEVTDEVILKEFFLLDPANENYKEMIVMQCPISATMSEIIIINADDVSAAEADLEARKTKAIEQDAWYPNDQELAAASIVGTNGNYAYYIIGTNAASAEKSINDYISSLS